MSKLVQLQSCCVLVAAAAATNSQAGYTNGYAHFGAQSDTIQILGNTIFNSGAFTYEMQIRLAPGAPIGQVISEQRDTYEDKTLRLGADGTYTASGSASHPLGHNQGQLNNVPTEQWFHLAYVYDGTYAKLYVNGALSASHITTGVYGDHSGSWMSIGMFRYGAGWGATPAYSSFLGDLDWIHVSAGAKYTSDFVAPEESQISADSSTQLLLKFNEAAGTSVLYDESASHFVCNLGVAVSPGVIATSPTLGNVVPGPAASGMLVLCGLLRRRRRS
jgi:hypothetical protein